MGKRYGYLDMQDDYTDIGDYDVEATCLDCHKKVWTIREAAWLDEKGKLVFQCGCAELEEYYREFR